MMRRTYLHICRQFFAVGAFLLLAVFPAWAVEVVLVAHPDTQTGTLSSQDVQMIFLGKKTTWPDGSRIVPLVQVESDVTVEFLDEMLELTPQQYYLYWRKALFTGQGIPPAEVANDREMQKLILEKPGSIGYISKGSWAEETKQIKSK